MVRCEPGQPIADGIFSTGEVAGPVGEHAMVVATGEGLVVLTGCAHPGVTSMVDRVGELSDRPVRLVMGGFHLGGAGDEHVHGVIDELRRLGVALVAPSHCTGERARELFRAEYGSAFVYSGAGRVISAEQLPGPQGR